MAIKAMPIPLLLLLPAIVLYFETPASPSELAEADRLTAEIEQSVTNGEFGIGAESMSNLAILLEETGDYRAAQPLYEEALTIRERAFGIDHLDVTGSLINLGCLLWKIGDYSGARREPSRLPGNPPAAAGMGRLSWTRAEVGRVASLIPEGRTLLGSEASEQELVRLVESGALREFNTIHLATHAFVDDEAPERSALVLSQESLPDPLEAVRAGSRVYDGYLTAQEITREWDLDADLVTLSGCQTGLGREIAGEGYIGLAHAFLQAGAGSLLVSLWRVEDEATCLLMGRFYENLTGVHQGQRVQPMPKAEALREAKNWLRRYTNPEGERVFEHPVYWSGFVMIGDPT